MKKYVLKRILYMVFVLVIVSFLMYCLYNLIPNDPARAELEGIKKTLKPEQYEVMYQQLRDEMGLDDPIIVRYGRWIGVVPEKRTGEFNGILQGNMGYSSFFKVDVTEVIPSRMVNTIFINVFVTILALAITIPLGIVNGFFCVFKLRISGEDNHMDRNILLPQPPGHLQPIHFGHTNICND